MKISGCFSFYIPALYFCAFGENADDGIGRRHLAGEIQMCINVACGADVTVAEPFLNLFQAYTIGIEQAASSCWRS